MRRGGGGKGGEGGANGGGGLSVADQGGHQAVGCGCIALPDMLDIMHSHRKRASCAASETDVAHFSKSCDSDHNSCSYSHHAGEVLRQRCKQELYILAAMPLLVESIVLSQGRLPHLSSLWQLASKTHSIACTLRPYATQQASVGYHANVSKIVVLHLLFTLSVCQAPEFPKTVLI